MAPIKFEENIRERLQERELTPSSETWRKLQSQLDEVRPKRKRPFVWYAVAASLITILVIGGLLLRSNTEVANDFVAAPQESTTNEEAITFSEEANSTPEILQQNTNVTEGPTTQQIKEKSDDQASLAKETSKERVEAKTTTEQLPVIDKIDLESTQSVAVEEPLKQEEVIEAEIPTQPSFIESKVNEVVAQAKALNSATVEVTAEEIDALLTKAQREIANQRLLDSGSGKIDATALLNDVEGEMERSFRDKVFEALGEGFNKVRTAVAERNN